MQRVALGQDWGVVGRVDWSPLPDVYDVFMYPDLTLKVPKGPANFERTLAEAFPAEKQAIGEYFRDIKRASNWFSRHIMSMVTPWPVSAAVRAINGSSEDWALQTTQQYLENHIRDPPEKLPRPRERSSARRVANS